MARWRVSSRFLENEGTRGSVLFHGALQRVLMAPGGVDDLGDLRFGHLVGVNATDPDTVLVHVKHDACRVFARLGEEAFQDVNDELHGSVVVVQYKNAIE